MPRFRTAALAVVLLLAVAPRARADATLFLGANLSPANRPARGAALGMEFFIVGFEFEYSNTADDATAGAPALTTGMANVFLQTPMSFLGIQPYITTGAGFYRETLGPHEDTSLGLNTGAGVKIALVGPLRLRIDYRVFKLGSGALFSPAQRVYAGVNLKF
jgi:opacity protein-like surface antigen